jgi:hypothetical protein
MIDLKQITEQAEKSAQRAYTASVFKQGLQTAIIAIMEASIKEKEASINDKSQTWRERELKELFYEGLSRAAKEVKIKIGELAEMEGE